MLGFTPAIWAICRSRSSSAYSLTTRELMIERKREERKQTLHVLTMCITNKCVSDFDRVGALPLQCKPDFLLRERDQIGKLLNVNILNSADAGDHYVVFPLRNSN